MEALTETSKDLLKLLLKDGDISSIFIDHDHRELYKKLTIEDNGDFVLGKTNFVWWNRLFGDEKTISFTDFALKAIKVLSNKPHANENIVREGLVDHVIKKLLDEENPNCVVDVLFDCARYGVRSSVSTRGISIGSNVRVTTRVTTRTKRVGYVNLPGSGESVFELVETDNN